MTNNFHNTAVFIQRSLKPAAATMRRLNSHVHLTETQTKRVLGNTVMTMIWDAVMIVSMKCCCLFVMMKTARGILTKSVKTKLFLKRHTAPQGRKPLLDLLLIAW